MAAEPSAADHPIDPALEAARAELDHVRWMIDAWKQRGQPIIEKATLEARLAAAEARVATLIDPGPPAPAETAPPAEHKAHRERKHKHDAHQAATATAIATSSTAKAAHSMIDKETDARFWAQTGYKVGQKLDTANPTDRAMAKVWSDIYNKVKAEDAAGSLVLTYNHPAVEHHLDNAAAAHDAAVAHLDAGDAASAHAAAGSGAQSAAQAAALQPPTVSPDVAHAAASEATQQAAAPAPPPVVIPPKHPARGPAARPTIEITSPGILEPAPPKTAADHLAVTQARDAGRKAVEVHGVAAAVPRPVSTVHPGTIANIRASAHDAAMAHAGAFVAAALMPDDTWQITELPSREALDGWYGTITDHADSFKYAAVWDKTDAANWPAAMPSNETFGSGKAIDVRVAVDRPPAQVVTATKTNYGPAIALGATAVAAGAAVFAGRRRKRKGY